MRSSSGAIRRLTCEPVVDAFFQHIERQTSPTEDLVMEGPYIEAGAEPPLCTLAQFQDLELAYLVTEALSGPCNIPVNFSLDRRLIWPISRK